MYRHALLLRRTTFGLAIPVPDYCERGYIATNITGTSNSGSGWTPQLKVAFHQSYKKNVSST
jgi:hypothetical protein